MSSSVSPAIFSALRIAGTGPMPKRSGSTPAVAYATTRAIGHELELAGAAPSITSTAAAPSLIWLELPAVTVPFT
jgi:hypothetical protein